MVRSVISDQADLALTKSASTPTVTTGDAVTYTLPLANNGPSASSGIVVTDNLPASLSFVSCSSTGVGVCGGTGNNRTVSFASLASGGSESITLTASLGCSVPDQTIIANTGTVSVVTPDNNPVLEVNNVSVCLCRQPK